MSATPAIMPRRIPVTDPQAPKHCRNSSLFVALRRKQLRDARR